MLVESCNSLLMQYELLEIDMYSNQWRFYYLVSIFGSNNVFSCGTNKEHQYVLQGTLKKNITNTP